MPPCERDEFDRRRELMRLILRRLRETVRTSGFAADAMVDGEEAVGIEATLDAGKARVVRAPEGVLPIGLEVVAFVDIGTGLRRGGAQRGHGGLNAERATPAATRSGAGKPGKAGGP